MKITLSMTIAHLGLLFGLAACSDSAQFAETTGPGAADASAPEVPSSDPNSIEGPGESVGSGPTVEDGSSTLPPTSGGPVVGSGEGDVPSLQLTCAQGEKKTLQQSIHFPERRDCSFGANGNLDRLQNFLQAVEGQTATINLPAGSQLCGLGIGSAATTIQYDDFMILTLNNHVLLASNQKILNGLQGSADTSYKWDFDRIKGVEVDFNSPHYCMGTAASLCEVPVTDTPGQFQFNIDPASLENLAEKIVGQQALNFGLFSTGDDNDRDCFHTAFTLDFTLEYVD